MTNSAVSGPQPAFIEVGEDGGQRRIAVRARIGGAPGLFWLGGFNSDMQGTKALALDAWAAEHHRACVRFDYSGHGESGGAFVIIDRKTQHIIGSTRFYGYDPEKSEIEIGWTFLARKYWGGRYNAEMKRLLLNHAFKFVESVVFFVGEDNVRSQKAMEKVGAIKAGTATRTYGNRPPTPNVTYGISKGAKLRVDD